MQGNSNLLFRTKTTIDNQPIKSTEKKCAKSAPMEGVRYKGLKLVKGERWYVEYFFKIPEVLRHEHNFKEWKRFRHYGEIDRRKGDAKLPYALDFFDSIRIALNERDFNPFIVEDKYLVKKSGKSTSIKDAIAFFKQNIHERSLDKDTEAKYIRIATYFENYLIQVGKQNLHPDDVDDVLISDCLQFYKKSVPWSNRHYNNQLGYLSIMFNYLKDDKKKISHNPCDTLKKLKFISSKHKYYDDTTLNLVLDKMNEVDPYLRLAALFVYYAGVRSAKELVGLQVGDILMQRDRIRFKGAETKGKRTEYIFLDPLLKKAIEESGIMNYPPQYYIFNHTGKPRELQASDDYLQSHFRKIRRLLGLGEDYTLYSFKHTRAVHLLLDGAQPVDIMQLFRHKELSATTKYIRDLGFDLNVKFADKSRKI